MNAAQPLAAEQSYPVFVIFAVVVACALLLAGWLAPERETINEYFTNNRRLSATQNGIAFFGDYISAAALLGVPGLIALNGYDGLLYLLGPIVALALILLLIAEPFHRAGRYTVADAIARRLHPRPVHKALGISTLAASLLYLTAQLAGVGALAGPLLGLSGSAPKRILVASLGILMIIYVTIGGMRATTIIQCIKALVLLAGSGYLALLVLSRFNWSPSELLAAAVHSSGKGDAFLRPGQLFGDGLTSNLDTLSLQLALVLGAAGLPHVLMRLRAVPTARKARASVQGATVLTSAFGLTVGVLGFGAVAALGVTAITDQSSSGHTATLLLAESMGGSLLLAVMSCVVFVTILAVVAGVLLAAATSLAHDLYSSVIKSGRASEKQELFTARLSVVVIGAAATALSMFAQNINPSVLIGLAFSVAASAILPTILYSFYWKTFTTTGAIWSIYGGLISSIILTLLSPGVSGNATALLPAMDFAYFPLRNPGIVSIPLSFLLGWLGTILGKEPPDRAKYAEFEVRTLTDAPTR
ncbi:solute symporter family protein [Streptomyces peucetius]|nr:cation acetate symporter [Streptomyces peucetius subsp. caesius ATCC 27952]